MILTYREANLHRNTPKISLLTLQKEIERLDDTSQYLEEYLKLRQLVGLQDPSQDCHLPLFTVYVCGGMTLASFAMDHCDPKIPSNQIKANLHNLLYHVLSSLYEITNREGDSIITGIDKELYLAMITDPKPTVSEVVDKIYQLHKNDERKSVLHHILDELTQPHPNYVYVVNLCGALLCKYLDYYRDASEDDSEYDHWVHNSQIRSNLNKCFTFLDKTASDLLLDLINPNLKEEASHE